LVRNYKKNPLVQAFHQGKDQSPFRVHWITTDQLAQACGMWCHNNQSVQQPAVTICGDNNQFSTSATWRECIYMSW